MKKFIVVIMALITILSASVTAFASYQIALNVLGEIVNAEFNSRVCTLREAPSSKPYFSPNMCDSNSNLSTQKTTYDSLFSLYDYLTINGISFTANIISPAVVEWYKATDLLTGSQYYVILVHVDESALQNAGKTGFVSNYAGKILYCDAPVEGDGYTISAIAGATGYCLTNRPAGTTGNGYLGDLLVTQDNLTTIHGVVDGLGGAADYYVVLRIVNGEYRYYIMCTYPNRQQYFVCNTSGQLFYALRDEVPDDGGNTGGGSTFDPTEVITAINSVYSAINSMNSNLGTRLANILNATNGISISVENLASNVVTGFTGVQEQLSTLNSYFTDLSGLFPVQETITLLGSDTRVAWDSADRITNVTAAGFNGDLIVKERPGDLVDESGYEKVTSNETEYSLYKDTNGYRRIKADNEYPDTGATIPDDTFCYFTFDNTLSSTVGDIDFYDAIYPSQYSTGISGNAILFNGTNYLQTQNLGTFMTLADNAMTISYWVYIPSYTTGIAAYTLEFGNYNGISCFINVNGYVGYHFLSGTSITSYVLGQNVLPLNQWVNIAFVYDGSFVYCFLNGILDVTQPMSIPSSFTGRMTIGEYSSRFPAGSMVDELIWVNGLALWTSDFDSEKEALFSEVAKDYFLACTDQDITLNFYDSTGEQVTEHRWNQYTVNTSRLPNGYSEVEYIEGNGSPFINTGVYVNSTSFNKLRVVYESSYSTFSNSYYLVNGISSSGNIFYCGLTNTGSVAYGNGTQDINVGQTLSLNTRYIVDFSPITGSYSVGPVSRTGLSFNAPSTWREFYLFAYNTGTGAQAHSERLYSCQIYDNGTLVRDFVPCINSSNAVGLYDLANGQFYGNAGTGSFTAGNEVSNGSGIGQLVGVVSSTNANAYPNDGIQGDFYYEYIGAYTEYPSFSQTLSPTDVNGNAITMGRLEDDFSEIYMDISTMQWYCHDPQTQTEILLSSANQQIMNDTIYVRQNYTMLPADQITADAVQNLLPVDSPVYLDMPEGAKLTITYDHYSGWFRMMYILMDKQTKLLSDLDIVNETIINVENTVIDITNNNPAYNVFYITKTDGTTESVGDAAKDAAVFVGDVLSMFYRLVFDDALSNVGILKDFEGAYSNTEVSVW